MHSCKNCWYRKYPMESPKCQCCLTDFHHEHWVPAGPIKVAAWWLETRIHFTIRKIGEKLRL
jgi:hypothetical protein